MIRTKITKNFEDYEIFGEEILGKEPSVVGLDTETTVRFDGQKQIGVDLIQICLVDNKPSNDHISFFKSVKSGNYTVYIFCMFQHYDDILPSSLRKILESNRIIKVGCDITTDIRRIKEIYDLEDKGFVDTQFIAKSIGIMKFSLEDLSQTYLGLGKEKKKKKFTIWDERSDTYDYEYASFDAYLSLCTYLHLVSGPKIDENKFEMNNNEEIKDVFTFLTTKTYVFSGKKATSREKIVNMIANSYTPWNRTLSKPDITIKVDFLINEWLELEWLTADDLGLSLNKINVIDKNMNTAISLELLESLKKKKNMKKDDIIHLLSYYDTSKDSIDAKIERARKQFNELLTNGHLLLIPNEGYTLNDPNDQKIIIALRKIIPPTGIKKESMINWIRNSYFQEKSTEERLKLSARFVNKLIENGQLMKIGNIKYMLR